MQAKVNLHAVEIDRLVKFYLDYILYRRSTIFHIIFGENKKKIYNTIQNTDSGTGMHFLVQKLENKTQKYHE